METRLLGELLRRWWLIEAHFNSGVRFQWNALDAAQETSKNGRLDANWSKYCGDVKEMESKQG